MAERLTLVAGAVAAAAAAYVLWRSWSAQTVKLSLRYFPLLPKGLGPALVLEYSGLEWSGNATIPYSSATLNGKKLVSLGSPQVAEWKGKAPFGQFPLLTVEAADGSTHHVGQTAAIVNTIAKLAGMEGDTVEAYSMSQMLIAECEDLWGLYTNFLPHKTKRLSTKDIMTPKGTAEDYAIFWSELLYGQLVCLDKLAPFGRLPGTKPLPGELYLFSILYQAYLVKPECLSPHSNLKKWFEATLADPVTQRVLNGQSPMGTLVPWFCKPDSPDVASFGDAKGRWDHS